MSFDKNYPNRKDHRKPYHGSKAFDASCRPGGSCPYCNSNRTIGDKRREQSAQDRLAEVSTVSGKQVLQALRQETD